MTQAETKLLILLAVVLAVAVYLKHQADGGAIGTSQASVTADNAATWDVPESWITAVIQTESAGDPYAYRAEPQINDASYGLMQLLYSTAKGLGYSGTPEGLYDPATNVYYGAKLLSQLRARYGNDPAAVYSAYNSGSATRYQTSSQVAANVNRFLANLDRG